MSCLSNEKRWQFSHLGFLVQGGLTSQYMKIAKKVAFNIASEASYIYILSGQKLIKNVKNGPICRVFENMKLAVKPCYQTGQF